MTEYITHIDEANHRANALQRQLGLSRTEFIDNLDAVNALVAQLEAKTQKPQPAAKPTAAGGGDLAALKARSRQLMQSLGLFPQYQADCKTVAEYQAQIAGYEARLKTITAPKPAKPEPAAPVSLTLGFYRSGKSFGLAKAMGAAAEKAQR